MLFGNTTNKLVYKSAFVTTESFGRTLVQGKDDFGYFPGEIVNASNSNMKEIICCFHTLQWFVVVSTLSVFLLVIMKL